MIEAVTVCINYPDYLAVTLPIMLQCVDRVTVVTSLADEQTQAVANRFGAECITTKDVFVCRGRPCHFNKGAAINAGLRTLRRDAWVLHVDADIALLDANLALNESALLSLDRHTLYGAKRLRVIGVDEWQRLIAGRRDGFPAAIVHSRLPSGFFQLWHWPTCPYWYSDDRPDASGSDWDFSKRWPMKKIVQLTNVTAWHLEMPGDSYKANWRGRTTPRFTDVEPKGTE